MAPRDEVFGTVELFEQILLRLPFLELIRKQRVCRAWRDCVRHSIHLQRKLFKTPIDQKKAPKTAKHSHYSVQPIKLNPLLPNVFRVRRSDISGASIALGPPPGKSRLQNIRCLENVLQQTPNRLSLVEEEERPVLLGNRRFYGQRQRRRSLDTLRRHLGFSRGHIRGMGMDGPPREIAPAPVRAETYACDAWADMLLTQPPLRTLSIRAVDTRYPPVHAKQIVASDGEGIRVGELVEAAAKAYQASRLRNILIDVEFEIFQPLESTGPHRAMQVNDFGQLQMMDMEEDDHCLRAWRTRLKCNFG